MRSATWGEGPYEVEYAKQDGRLEDQQASLVSDFRRAVCRRLGEEQGCDTRASTFRKSCRRIARHRSVTTCGRTCTCRRSTTRTRPRMRCLALDIDTDRCDCAASSAHPASARSRRCRESGVHVRVLPRQAAMGSAHGPVHGRRDDGDLAARRVRGSQERAALARAVRPAADRAESRSQSHPAAARDQRGAGWSARVDTQSRVEPARHVRTPSARGAMAFTRTNS